MYYVGICVYVSAMVDDLAIALDKLDQSLRDQSAERTAHTYSQQALANAIRFHNEIIEHASLSNFYDFFKKYFVYLLAHVSGVIFVSFCVL